MKERPILFSAPMVRALLDDSKTQTRRVVKLPARHYFAVTPDYPGQILVDGNDLSHGNEFPVDELRCPYGQRGDRLWVRETTVKVEDHGYEGPVFAESNDGRNVIEYGLSPGEDDVTEVEPEEIKLRPSIFMPRAMCRITLEIVSVRVERLQDISERDAWAEGCEGFDDDVTGGKSGYGEYAELWESINGSGSWDLNPWVWVIEFKRVTP